MGGGVPELNKCVFEYSQLIAYVTHALVHSETNCCVLVETYLRMSV